MDVSLKYSAVMSENYYAVTASPCGYFDVFFVLLQITSIVSLNNFINRPINTASQSKYNFPAQNI